MRIDRRQFLKAGVAAASVVGLGGCATMGGAAKARVVVVGGGYGGATAAKHISCREATADSSSKTSASENS